MLVMYASRDGMSHVNCSKSLTGNTQLNAEDILGMDSALAQAKVIVMTPMESAIAA
jgi:hypothetical protein